MQIFPIVDYKHDCFQEYKDECSLVLWCYNCNWFCKWCSLKNIIYDKENILEDKNVINMIKNTTEMETAVVFLGGEPTIHPAGLYLCCSVAKEQGLKTKVFTNGSNPKTIIKLFEKNILDAVSIDYKNVNDSLELLRLLPIYYDIDIRITLHEGISDTDLKRMHQKVKIINSNAKIYLQNLIKE